MSKITSIIDRYVEYTARVMGKDEGEVREELIKEWSRG